MLALTVEYSLISGCS